MSNNNIIEYKESFISKIKKIFTNLFKNKKEQKGYSLEIFNLDDKEEKDFCNYLKVNTSNIDKCMDKKKFLEYIDGNIVALELLSVDRLIKLKEYYDVIIKKNDKIIKKLKEDN